MSPEVLTQHLSAQHLSSDVRSRVHAAVTALDAWGWALDEAALAAHLSRALARGKADLAFEDLVLAAGASEGLERAWAVFEQRCRPPVRAALTKVLGSDGALDEEQALFTLLAHRERSPLRTYLGDGPLAGWLAVVATRRAWKAARAASRVGVIGDDVLLERVAEGPQDPALAVFKATHRDTFRDAIKSAFTRLTVKERNLLRLHHLDGVQTAELARLHGVHRATVVRWLADARQSFVSNFRDEFAAKLKAPRLDVDSLARVFQGSLDISLPMESVDVASRGEP
jgi:RNA polymerase sigma-70 factor, ECF subfamily